MVGPKKQAFCPRINMLKGNFDTNYFEPLMILSCWSSKSWLSWFSMWIFLNTVWNRCWDNCLQLLGFWNFFVFFFDFFRSNSFIIEPKVEKTYMGDFPLNLCHWFLLSTENHKWFKVVGIKISFEHVDFWAKSLLFRTHHLWNSTTELILVLAWCDFWFV